MNNSPLQFELMEANLESLKQRMPDLPVSGILLCRLLLHIGREMSAKFEQQIRPFGLNEAEFRVLSTLFSQPDGAAHPGDLCMRASQSPANMSRISDALLGRGLITRVSSVHDRRRMVLRITQQGEEFVRTLLPKLHVPLRRMLQDFPETEQRQLAAQLKRLGMELDHMNMPDFTEPAL
ncbi:MAG TPA: MarR family transcriptional regulator [Steroidobacteraceae bacterium]|jgi:MarR family transcriptional repressor of emrRAB|nr:MarR family transcriptional regulator [Steroidobacteraceae bacterium]